MLPTEEKTEKDHFFESLYGLDDFDDDEETEVESSVKVSGHTTKRAVDHKSGKAFQIGKVKPNQHRAHEKPFNQGSQAAPVILSDDEEVRQPPSTDRAFTKSQTTSISPPKPTRAASKRKPEVKGPPSPRRGATKKKKVELRRNVTDLSNIKQRKLQLPPRLRRTQSVPLEQQIFTGLLFFFVPNNDEDSIRRLQIHRAVEYGATWANEWYDDVTHIIVCGDLDVSQASKIFTAGKLPHGPALVRENWVTDCTSAKELKDPARQRFLVPGFEHLDQHPGTVPSLSRSISCEDSESLRPAPQTKRGDTTPSRPDPNAKSRFQDEDTESEDELDSALKDVCELGNLPDEPSFDDNAAPSTDKDESDPALDMLMANDNIRKENAGFQCMEKNDGSTDKSNPNEATIEMLQKLASKYDSKGDHFRTTAFRKAIAALRKQTGLIRTKQQALEIPQIGESIAAIIEEYVAKNRVQRLDAAEKDTHDQTLELFTGIYGAGYQTAMTWLAQGFRTLEDIRQKAQLNPSQRVGLEHYDDFQQRIPRDEVTQHAEVVRRALKAVDRGFQLTVGGSYRRGKKDCGDIDCIITKENADIGHIRTLMMDTVIPNLTDQGFLKAALAAGRFGEPCSKWHGASVVPGSKAWRRIDFLFVPWAELGAALIYFTGNDLFNRSLRLLASRKRMRLNQHGLYKDVMRGRGRERITDGTLLEGHDERRIFEILGVPYRPPGDRQIGG
ncbi:DNA polymerase IV [Exophiala viscosa]|uniref:DNA polymerase lambda n=1 Tax=Exophiala viscosa TaxID=2486360 RepID=A0AAN6E3W2_9EURO|nr:DNA polymerase IV [Exophiala viscosa]KAI1629821.1 DNA polymerase IV [Exophiala viscosa]